MSVSRLLVIYNSGYVLPFPYTYVHKCLPHLQPFGCLVVPSNNGSAMFCFLLLISDKAKHCRAIGQNGEMIKKLQIPCLFHINVCYICNFSLVWSFRPTMFCFLLLKFNKAKHCRDIGQKDETIERLQTWLTYIRGLQLLQSSSRHSFTEI